jgi:hypothetical protein
VSYEETEEIEELQSEEVPGLPSIAQGEAAPNGQNSSLFEQLREKRAEAAAGTETFIPIPGYDSEAPVLLAKYRVLDGKELDTIGRKVQKQTKDRWNRQILAAMDSCIAACEGMYIDMLDGSEPQPLTFNEIPILGFTGELAQALQYEATNAREVFSGLFLGNEVAMIQHNVRLSLWMGNTSRKVDQDMFMGEA